MNRTIIYLLLTFSLVCSCTEEEIDKSDPDLVGSWKLVEILEDPGDGSGEFVPISSNKIVVFSLEGTFTSNGNLCRASSEANMPSSGTYNVETSEIIVNDCVNFASNSRYRIENDSLLIFGFGCIEGCAEKYMKID